MARETINGVSVPVPDTGEPADFVGDLRRVANDLPTSIDQVTKFRLAFSRSLGAAETGIARIMLNGMSIASFTPSLPQLATMVGEHLRLSPFYAFNRAGLLGGSWENAYLGWAKQPYGGLNYTRARGASSSTAMTFAFFGDRLNAWFSREANSEACDVLVDGVAIGASPAPGAQVYAQKVSWSGTLGMHTVTFTVPAGAGYCYLEHWESFDSTRPGIGIIDATLGGSTWGQMKALRTPTGAQVAGIAIEGTNGVDAYYNRDDVALHFAQHDVNDAGSGSAYITANTLPMIDRAVELTRDRALPLLLISSMAGHYAMPNDAGNGNNFANYNTIKAKYQAVRRAESHVEHLDWDAMTRLANITKYQQTYYPTVTGLNIAAGTYSGDFIHPDTSSGAYHALQQGAARLLGIPAPKPWASHATDLLAAVRRSIPVQGSRLPRAGKTARLVATSYVIDSTADTITTPRPHGLAIGDAITPDGGISGVVNWGGKKYVVAVPTPTTFQVSDTVGGAIQDFTFTSPTTRTGAYLYQLDRIATYSTPAEGGVLMVGGGQVLHVPVYRDPLASGLRPQTAQDLINASGTSDRWGKYLTWTNQAMSGNAAWVSQNELMLIVRFSGTFFARTSDNVSQNNRQTIPIVGGDAPYTDVANQRTDATVVGADAGDEPLVAAYPFRQSALGFIQINATRVYEAHVVPRNGTETTVVLPGI